MSSTDELITPAGIAAADVDDDGASVGVEVLLVEPIVEAAASDGDDGVDGSHATASGPPGSMTMYVPENFVQLVTEEIVDATPEDWLTDELIQELKSAMPRDSDIDKSTTCRDVTRLATECARIFHKDRELF
jgi:hypothetical protein